MRSVRSGVHPGLVRAHGGGAVQRRRRETDPQKQSEFPGATAAFLQADLGRYELTRDIFSSLFLLKGQMRFMGLCFSFQRVNTSIHPSPLRSSVTGTGRRLRPKPRSHLLVSMSLYSAGSLSPFR